MQKRETPSLSQVQGWQPWKITEAGQEIKDRNIDFRDLVNRMGAQIQAAETHWGGRRLLGGL